MTMEMLRWVSDELGVACLVSLHQVDYAIEYSDRIVALKKGVKVFDGTPDELDAKIISDIYGTPYVHEGAHGVEEENAGARGADARGSRVAGACMPVAGAAGAGARSAGGALEAAAGAAGRGTGAERQGAAAVDAAELDRAAVAAVIEEAKAVTRANAEMAGEAKPVARAHAGKPQLRTDDAPHVEVGA